MPKRAELVDRIKEESRRHYAAWTLLNQTMADHLGLHPTDLQCLSLLAMEREPLSTGEVARLAGLTPGSATRLVDRLEKAGLVERHADPGDRRRALVALAPAAQSRISAAWDVPGGAFMAVLDGYGDEELAVIGDYLRKGAEVGRTQAERLRAAGRAGESTPPAAASS
ncbi:MarR family winged helix-turn-helix transcriptional regulator [Streptomyces rectiverticillatus]|uniref:MarR family winged helix-turn-helix transcriptional regulator n=1 Tax=Streptomyces rectiverticillatus TaxID=173860 RepID=UPI001FE709FD|nr:MarR family transcriptional regulator [Streptomyces rectiverticillatus]